MAKVKIAPSLFKEIQKKFKGESHKIIDFIETLKDNPNKGKIVGNVGGLLIKEIKFEGFRFYFIVEGHKLKILSVEELKDLLIRFVRMSNKKDQQKVINEIKVVLRKIGEEEF
ncbi:MAG: hypothetical protein NUV46_01070 [Nanoarchaeota archaeon]|nr:hypothetical protein [Nanoarchaeota archaeon]